MKKTVAMILAACILASALSLPAFAGELPEEQEQTETPLEEVVTDPQEDSSEEVGKEPPEESPDESSDDPSDESKEEPSEEASVEAEEEPSEESKEEPVPTTVFHSITIDDDMMEKGYVIPSRRTAKPGDAIVLTANEREYTEDGKKMKMQFINFETESDVTMIPLNHTTAFFFMPDEDIVIRAVFEEVDKTEYFDWQTVISNILHSPDGSEVYVDMKEETEIPNEVIVNLSGLNVNVSFMTKNCFFTMNGKDIDENLLSDKAYSISYTDYTLPKYYLLKLKNSAVLAIEAEVQGEHSAIAFLHCFCDKNIEHGYLYRLNGQDTEFISVVTVKNGETTLPVSESGVYAVTTKVLAGTEIAMAVNADKRVLVNDKLLPLCSYEDGMMYFTVTDAGSLMMEDYRVPFTDIKNHTYEDSIRFAAIRNLIDGTDDTTFQPDAAVTVDDLVFAIARLRQISDKAAMDFCKQAGILNGSYSLGTFMTHNDVSLIMTNFANYVAEHPKQFGNIRSEAFDRNAAGWVGIRFLEMVSNERTYDWNGSCTRGELAYLLTAMVNSMVGGTPNEA